MGKYNYDAWDVDEIREMVEKHVRIRDIAEKYDCSMNRVSTFLRDNDIRYKKMFSASTKEVQERHNEIDDLFHKGESILGISKELGLKYSAVYHYIKKHVSSRSLLERNGKSKRTVNAIKARQKLPQDAKDEIERLYHDDKLSMYEIADIYNVTASAIHGFLRKHGIATRSKRDAGLLLYERRPELREYFRQLVYDGVTGYPSNTKRTSWIEDYCAEWLSENGIQFVSEYQINGTGHSYDFRVGNVLIEMDGIYWHDREGQKVKDAEFERIALENRFTVIRITDKEIREHGDAIMYKKLECLLNENR